MDIKEIKSLTALMVENDLAEIMIRDGEKRIFLKRRETGVEQVMDPAATSAPACVPAAVAAPAALERPQATEAAPAAGPVLPAITSPMVGTFYAAQDPESPPFVKVGDKVGPDMVVCIIEAMKVFNEIKAELSGTVESIEVADAQPVEFGQVLIKVRPD